MRLIARPINRLIDYSRPALILTAIPGVPRYDSSSISTPYSAWKMFIHESILTSIAKFTTEEAVHRGDTDFSLSLDELESFIALQYARGLYGKNHPVAFLWNKRYGIPIFHKNILDIAAINACAIFIKSTGTQISRRDFILEFN